MAEDQNEVVRLRWENTSEALKDFSASSQPDKRPITEQAKEKVGNFLRSSQEIAKKAFTRTFDVLVDQVTVTDVASVILALNALPFWTGTLDSSNHPESIIFASAFTTLSGLSGAASVIERRTRAQQKLNG